MTRGARIFRLPATLAGRYGRETLVVSDRDSEIRPYAGDLFVPDRITVTLDDPFFPYLVLAVAERRAAGFETTDLRLHARDGRRLRAADLRDLALDALIESALPKVTYRAYRMNELIREMLAQQAPDVDTTTTTDGQVILLPVWFHPDHDASVADAVGSLGRRSAKRLDRLNRVADAYRDAKAAGVPVGDAVSTRLNVSEATARQYIVQARKEGLIPPTRRGQPKKEESNG